MKISLKQKKLKDNTSLFVEYYNGSTINEEGKRVHDRKQEYLGIYLHNTPSNAKEKRENKENLELADKIYSIRKAAYAQGKFDINQERLGDQIFLEYYSEKKAERYDSKANYNNWDATEKHLIQFCPKSLKLNQVDEKFINGFKNYLDNKARTKSSIGLSQNSKYTYFNKFKACIRAAYEEGLISKNYLKNIKSFKQGESQREYLTLDELQLIFKTECRYPVLKKAFIFSCLTGLRWSDINKMDWHEVREEGIDKYGNEIFRIIFTQQKTKGLEYLYISRQARDLLGDRQNKNERVFKGLKYSSTFNNEILRWMNRSGITKHITFHSARHTHAVLLLSNNADIYTVQKRLGHKEIRTTEIYAKIIDKRMKEAANLIPILKL